MGEAPRERESRDDSLDAHIGQVFNDFLDRRKQGETISEADLLAEHPEFAEELRDYFTLVQDLRSGEESVARLIEQGILSRPSDARHLAELGPYKITGLLGRGGIGIVLKAHEASLDRTVALKILRPDLIGDETALRRFTREAKVAAALRHPNIVTVHAVGDEGGTSFIAMEYIEGPTLADLIREQGTLPSDLIRPIFQQMLQGLAAAHDAGLIHRDVKPSNILLDRLAADAPGGAGEVAQEGASFIVKIADFGLARMVSAQTRITVGDRSPGTPEYMSPEQARGDENIDHRTELYSAGVVLYEMLTGRTPFSADAPSAVIYQILHTDTPDPRTVNDTADPPLASLAMRLMAKCSGDRFESAADTLAALDIGECVRSPERRCGVRRWLGSAVVFSGILVTTLWLWAFGGQGRAIQDVRAISDDGGKTKRIIEARFAGSREWVEFFTDFPPRVRLVKACDLFDPNGIPGSGDELVVIGVEPAWDGAGVVAIDLDRRVRWRLGLSPEAEMNWPDFDARRAPWVCRTLRVANVDEEDGEELIVAANHPSQYPARVSIIKADAQGARITSTFWHLGHIQKVHVVDSFFESGKPALVVEAQNNKLDGLGDPPPDDYTPLPGEDAPRTGYERVLALMVLDPADLNGIGPPRLPQLASLRGNVPYAYAQFNYPYLERDAGGLPIAEFDRLDVLHGQRDASGTWMKLEIIMRDHTRRVERNQPVIDGRGFLVTLDGVLTLRRHEPQGSTARQAENWLRWDPIIQKGAYISTLEESADSPADENTRATEAPSPERNGG